MDSTSPNQLAFNIWKHSNWLRPERNVKFLLNFRPHAAAFLVITKLSICQLYTNGMA